METIACIYVLIRSIVTILCEKYLKYKIQVYVHEKRTDLKYKVKVFVEKYIKYKYEILFKRNI